jgi:hypothetical protein
MYSSKGDYYADLGVMRSEASTVGAAGVRKTNTNAATYRYTVRRFNDDFGLAHLHFSMPDLYLKAVQIEAGAANRYYRFKGSTFAIVNSALQALDFKDDYAAMGWNKSQDALTVTLDDVNQAFFDLFGNQPSKKALRSIVIAFAEGFRFNKIAVKVATGEAISGKELDWSAEGASVYQGP